MRLFSPSLLNRIAPFDFLFSRPCPRSRGFIGSNRLFLSDSSIRSEKSAKDMAVAEEASPSRRLWNEAKKKEVNFAILSPFVVALASGGLETATFKNYIQQDVYFLKAFARAYEMAEECADDDDDKATISKLKNDIVDELKMHNSTLLGWGVDPAKETTVANPATTRYCNFLIATASGKVDYGKGPGKIATPFEMTKIAAYTVGAMAPCMRLYAHLGKELKIFLQREENDPHPHKKWIDTYSSKDFEDSARQIEELLDKLSISLTGEELAVIGKLYQQAMKLEVDFFYAQRRIHPSVVPLVQYLKPKSKLVIFSDFDLTCTTVDSSAILAEIAILTAQKADLSVGEPGNSSGDARASWNDLSTLYTEEYEQCIEKLLPSEEAKEFQFEGLHKGLKLLSEFERGANARVVDSGLLKGINVEDIKKAGERLILQDGCRNFFQNLVNLKQERDLDVHILSYCWCADLIRSAFSSVGCLDHLSIHSNEFSYEGSLSTGEISRNMESPLDKVEKFKSLLTSASSTAVSGHKSVYIGDSVGDLLCLLLADIGIVVGSSTSLRKVGESFGVSFVPLFPGVVEKQRQVDRDEMPVWRGLSGVLYTVSSWSEIHAFILGP
ncbi:aminopyrimidine aminohydrolase [Carex littledalei]|uniref:Aminopyrimidine aminohydrolase n=1 Tax=Carex littledalei TaxID=544730 RepID=A0A833VWK6_9POAL|nr:aminopyrimidine aminohydrolase [Carex littledalei]